MKGFRVALRGPRAKKRVIYKKRVNREKRMGGTEEATEGEVRRQKRWERLQKGGAGVKAQTYRESSRNLGGGWRRREGKDRLSHKREQ